jgi:Flp pilus assembly protein TadD/tRNA A-37 threonylcarbamoyl transferase component Bud32
MTAIVTGAEAKSPFVPGQFVASYRIVRQLGQGGMGAVFEAVHRDIERRVAIKVLHPHLSRDEHFADRFLNEARAVNLVDHPGLVEVSDYARLPDGTTFIVMEYLKGETLNARLERESEQPLDALSLGRQIASTLHAAHVQGIIHRDLKPDNVMLVPDREATGGERVKVLDFGIAKGVVAIGGKSDEVRRTQTGLILGTPTYMAPEQGRGTGEITDRADVYSLGVMLYQMLAGRPPFVARGMGEVLAMHLLCEPPPLVRYRASLSPRIVSLVHTMLSKDPKERPDMAQVERGLSHREDGGDLERVSVAPGQPDASLSDLSDSFTIGVVGRPAVERRAAAGRKVPVRAAIAGGAMMALALGGWCLMHFVPAPAPEAKRAAPDPPSVGLHLLRDFHVASGAMRWLLKEPDAWEAAAADFARMAGRTAPVHFRSGRAFCAGKARLLRGDVAGALRALREAVALEETWPDAHVALAEALDRNGERTAAMTEIHRAEELEPTWWVPTATGAVIQAHEQRLDEAIQGLRRALTLAPEEPAVLDGLALVLHAARLDSEAETSAEKALVRDPDLVWSRVLLAERALERGDGESALREATRAASVSPSTAAVQLARADALALLHRDAEAVQGYLHLLDLVKRSGGLDLPRGRLSVVREALLQGRLPPPRSVYTSPSHRYHRLHE